MWLVPFGRRFLEHFGNISSEHKTQIYTLVLAQWNEWNLRRKFVSSLCLVFVCFAHISCVVDSPVQLFLSYWLLFAVLRVVRDNLFINEFDIGCRNVKWRRRRRKQQRRRIPNGQRINISEIGFCSSAYGKRPNYARNQIKCLPFECLLRTNDEEITIYLWREQKIIRNLI